MGRASLGYTPLLELKSDSWHLGLLALEMTHNCLAHVAKVAVVP